MELVVEVLNRSNRLHDSLPVHGKSISIGRAFDNDVILRDPHVSAHHARIEFSDSGELLITDLESVNGIADLKHHKLTRSSQFQSGDGFILGKTHIRIYKKDHTVASTVRLTSFEKVLKVLGRPSLAVGLILFVFASSLFSIYLNTAQDIKWADKTLTVILVELLIIMWALGWSMIARIKKQDMRFYTQVSLIMLFAILMYTHEILFKWIGFHIGSILVVDVINHTLIAIALFTLIWLNLFLSCFQAPLERLVPALVLASLLFGLKYLVFDMEREKFKTFASNYSGALYPPSVTVYSTIDTKTFIEKSAYIFETPDPDLE